MSLNKRKFFFSYEIIYNTNGQLFIKKRLLTRLIINYYRFIFKGA